MKLVADAVNREFQLGETPLPSLYNSVSSILFGQNVIILRQLLTFQNSEDKMK